MSNKLTLNIKKYKPKVVKSNNKMKISFKLSKEETESWVNYCKIIQPENVSDEDFVRLVFFKGASVIRDLYEQKAREYLEQHPEALMQMGGEVSNITPSSVQVSG